VPPHQSSALTSIVVVTADSGPLVAQCVAHVLANMAPIELIVVDNASTDGQIEILQQRYADEPRLRIVRNSENLGFGAACNIGARIARGGALLFLNPDCVIENDTVERLVAVLDKFPNAGLVGVHVRQPDGSSEHAIRRRDPSLRRSLMQLGGLARFEYRWPSLAGINVPASPTLLEIEPVEAVSGACMFLPRAVFDRLGGFDEAYFLHCEDLDLCRRTRDAGYDVLFANSILVCHAQGSSSRQRPWFVARHKHRSMWRYFRRFDPAARNPVLRALVACGIGMHLAMLAPRLVWREYRARSNP
jgi:N-acetylglucosaminyl-diphospho-decaprenol L-rhamnosyltransferase